MRAHMSNADLIAEAETWPNDTPWGKFIAELAAAFAAQDKIIAEMREALAESLKLQSHYAKLLNSYDGGKRIVFASADEWLARSARPARSLAKGGDAKCRTHHHLCNPAGGERVVAAGHDNTGEGAMKITLEPTGQFEGVNGARCRIWRGTSDKGAVVIAYIAMVGCHKDATPEATGEFDKELSLCK